MACLSERRRASWRSSESSAPRPKACVSEAWKARVGYSRERAWSQRLVTHAGTCLLLLVLFVCDWVFCFSWIDAPALEGRERGGKKRGKKKEKKPPKRG